MQRQSSYSKPGSSTPRPKPPPTAPTRRSERPSRPVTDWWVVKPSKPAKATPATSSAPTPTTTPSTPIASGSKALPPDSPADDELNIMPGDFVGAASVSLPDPKTFGEALER